MLKLAAVFLVMLSVGLGGRVSSVAADEGMHFHCSVCSSHDHGSMWHDSDKDGTNDR